MSYKQNLLLISKILTTSNEESQLDEIKFLLQNDPINWENLVKISSANLVLPALYFKLKKNNLLSYLPTDLTNYLSQISEINRNRNKQIIKQIYHINELFKNKGFKPVYIKGAASLVLGLYNDISERMIGDIDVIFSKENYEKAIEILVKNGYTISSEQRKKKPNFRHYKKQIHKDYIAAVEIHKELVSEKYSKQFNFQLVQNRIISKNNLFVLGHIDHLAMTIFSEFLNNNGILYFNISLKSLYDVNLILKKFNNKRLRFEYGKLDNVINKFFVLYKSLAMVNSTKIEFLNSISDEKYKSKFLKIISNSRFRSLHKKYVSTLIFLKRSKYLLNKFLLKKEYQDWLFSKILSSQSK